MAEKSSNGFGVRSWSDIVAVSVLVSLCLGVIAWGLKLEGELNSVRNDVTELKMQVGKGVLPRAEERIESLDDRVSDLEDE